MGVYTKIQNDELTNFVKGFNIGEVLSYQGISEGIDNTNYVLKTTHGKFILTLFEHRIRKADIPFFLNLMTYLEKRDFPCPGPVANRNGKVLHELCGRPATIVNFASGISNLAPTSSLCRALGAAAAALHKTMKDFHQRRANDLSIDHLRRMFSNLGQRPDKIKTGLSSLVNSELKVLEKRWPNDLPNGVIHGDLFPDNVFFRNNRVSGIIDFYFSCNESLIFDLAVCINAWCFDNGRFCPERASHLIDGYQTIRKLTTKERNSIAIVGRGAALRFIITRIVDWFNTPDQAMLERKSPLELIPIIKFHRTVSDSSIYGL